jgi:hypothetical protein
VAASSLVVIVLTAIVLVAGGCGSDSGKPAPMASPVLAPPAGNPREEAAALAARGDYTAAEQRYREALEQRPDDFDLHYGLASVLSQLDRHDEAIDQFRWVVTNGRPGSPEVDSARRWLAEAEATAPAATTATRLEQPPRPALRGEHGATGTVSGKLTWPGIPNDRSFAIRVIVEGSGGSRKIVRSRLNASYTIEDLPPGTYKLTAAAGSMPVWKDVSVSVSSGEQTNLDLTPANAAVSPAEFPAR